MYRHTDYTRQDFKRSYKLMFFIKGRYFTAEWYQRFKYWLLFHIHFQWNLIPLASVRVSRLHLKVLWLKCAILNTLLKDKHLKQNLKQLCPASNSNKTSTSISRLYFWCFKNLENSREYVNIITKQNTK